MYASLPPPTCTYTQLVRLMRLWPVGETLHRGFRPLLDSRDAGPLIVTHFYLLLGFSLPIWLYPLRDYYRRKPHFEAFTKLDSGLLLCIMHLYLPLHIVP